MRLRPLSYFFILLFLFLPFVLPVYAVDADGYVSVSGYVKDNITRLPLAGTAVKIRSGLTHFSAFTDSSGYYSFDHVPVYRVAGRYLKVNLMVISLKYRTEFIRRALLPGETYNFDFYLDTRFKYPVLRGKVTDSSTSLGIEAAAVTVSGDGQVYTAATDGEGNYQLRIEDKGVGHFSVTASASGYMDSPEQPLKTFPLHNYTIDFSLDPAALGVGVSPDYWHVGSLEPFDVATMQESEKITVTNSGTGAQTYSLMLVNPQPWNDSQTGISGNQYVLNAAFSGDLAAVNWNESDHALSSVWQEAGDAKFAGDETGAGVASGEARTLWLQFKAPASTSTEEEQEIKVIINAQVP